MLTVHHLSNSRSQKIIWLLEELQVPYELKVYMRDSKTLAAPPEMKALHPMGKSPLISENGETISETGAIIDYILRHHADGKLQPPTESVAFDRFIEWMHYAEGSAMLPILMTIFCKYTATESAALNAMLESHSNKHLSYIEDALAGADYLVSNTFSAADIHVSFVADTAAQYMSLATYPNINAWTKRLRERDGYKRAEQKGGYFGPAAPK
ncbi:MAG: putative glutathione transferase [Verrucomicrobiaceae bacterium]|nr:putative glutathione transferase [Verrucomicrobiaceae bacterium]